ncbi:MAG: hypothetical protein H6553_05265 [Chitinophagales bacterium]|nr:hypothetical protein [Chitinophagales bacterium]
MENNIFCQKCGLEMKELELYIAIAPCWKCNESMKLAFIKGVELDIIRKQSTAIAPAFFKENELKLAQSKGVIIKDNYSNSINNSYYANTCPNCNDFIGNHYLFTEYVSPTINANEFEYQKYNLGFCCDSCDYDALNINDDYDETF